jgi:predicted GIY-YIG superfamily endonuclease
LVFGFDLVSRWGFSVPHFLYILQMSNGQLYVGTTSNLDERFNRHIHHQAARTTSVLGVERLLYSEAHPDRVTAEKRERQIKKWSRAKKLALVRGDLDSLKKLARHKNP